MTRFAFWNIGRRPLERIIAKMAGSFDLDFILLAESNIDPEVCLEALKHETDQRYHFYGTTPAVPRDLTTWLQVYSRLGSSQMGPVTLEENSKRFRVYRLHEGNPLAIDTLLVLAHAPSKFLGAGVEEEQPKFFRRLKRGIEEAEEIAEHRRTILVGDMNVDPFDRNIVDANGIQGIPIREVALRGHRKYDNGLRRFFYNPMWCLYGDRRSASHLADDPIDSDEPVVPGTYFFDDNRSHQLYWHMLDQVMIRSDLIPRLPLRELRIVGRIGYEQLVGKGRPTLSDHLPILFQLDLSRETVDAHR